MQGCVIKVRGGEGDGWAMICGLAKSWGEIKEVNKKFADKKESALSSMRHACRGCDPVWA